MTLDPHYRGCGRDHPACATPDELIEQLRDAAGALFSAGLSAGHPLNSSRHEEREARAVLEAVIEEIACRMKRASREEDR